MLNAPTKPTLTVVPETHNYPDKAEGPNITISVSPSMPKTYQQTKPLEESLVEQNAASLVKNPSHQTSRRTAVEPGKSFEVCYSLQVQVSN